MFHWYFTHRNSQTLATDIPKPISVLKRMTKHTVNDIRFLFTANTTHRTNNIGHRVFTSLIRLSTFFE